MGFAFPPRVQYALLPTPIERLLRCGGGGAGVEIWIKRDDLSGYLLTGNKVRKLEFTFARALAEGVHGVVTCGGSNSNHCRATAALAARLGLEAHLFLRTASGAAPERWQGNTLLDAMLGAHITWIDPRGYAERDRLLADYAASCAERGKRLYIIPEGASDAIGALGYVKAVEEILEQLAERKLAIDFLVHAVGSGGTTAGLTAGSAQFRAGWRVLGVAVCDDRSYFDAKIRSLRRDLEAFGLPPCMPDEAWSVVDEYKGRGYGLTTPDELRALHDFCRGEGILLDPCYTGKAYIGMLGEIAIGNIPAGSRVLFLHTGGGFGNFAYDREWGEQFASGEN